MFISVCTHVDTIFISRKIVSEYVVVVVDSKQTVVCGVTLFHPLVNQLQLSHTRFLATTDFVSRIYSENFIIPRSCDIAQTARNCSPTSTTVDWP